MASIIPGFEYDIFISYRQKDDRADHWVTEFVNRLRAELDATFKEEVSIYFDENPHDGLLETHNVDKSLEGKLKCLIFIPIVSQTYCDPKSFAWQHEFSAFNRMSKQDQFGRDIKLINGNVASRILPVKIHDLDVADKDLLEAELGGALRAVDFIFKSSGVNRPLRAAEDHLQDNLNKTFYRDQINKVANAIKELIIGIHHLTDKPKEVAYATKKMEKPRINNFYSAAAIVLLLGLAGYGLYYKAELGNEVASAADRSIAVLPFVNLSNDPKQEYLSDGLTEELITQLSQAHDLIVISPVSARSFKGTKKTSGEIAKELKVHYILEGSVRKSDKKLLITAQLIDAGIDANIWAEKFKGTMDDVFDIQEKVSRSIVEKLRVQLTPEEDEVIAKRNFNNAAAFECYLRARNEFLKFDQNAIDRAKKEIENGLNIIGPNAALYGGMAYVYFSYANMGVNAEENWKKAKEYVEKTLELDPRSPEGTLVLALIKSTVEGKMADAIIYLKKTLLLKPGDYHALYWLGAYYSIVGKPEKALKIMNTINRIDPLGEGELTDEIPGYTYFLQGQFNLAIKPLGAGFKKHPDNLLYVFLIGFTLNNTGHRKEAISFLQREIGSDSDSASTSTNFLWQLCHGLLYALHHDSKGLNRLMLRPGMKIFVTRDFYYSQLASSYYAMIGAESESLFWLENAINRGFLNYPFLSKYDPSYEPIRKSERFQKLMVRLKREWEEFNE